MTDAAVKQQSDAVLIAKYFDLRGKDALDAIKSLSSEDKVQMGQGIRDGSLNY
jgi:hypothetical protein